MQQFERVRELQSTRENLLRPKRLLPQNCGSDALDSAMNALRASQKGKVLQVVESLTFAMLWVSPQMQDVHVIPLAGQSWFVNPRLCHNRFRPSVGSGTSDTLACTR